MCGLVGYIDLRNERRIDETILVSMTDKIAYRGPDSCGYFIEDNVGLGFRRLSIIDLEGGHQPLYNEDESLVLICNGEIFNYPEWKPRLKDKGHVFATGTDVEVLLHLYEDYGDDLLGKLNAQFAFALYDREQERLLLARDQFGINPLYYTIADGFLIFASEIKAILCHPMSPRQVDPAGLDQIFSFPGLISPRTMFKGIHSLQPGHYMVVKGRDIKITEYWDLDYPTTDETCYDRPEQYYVDELRDIFAQSVRYRLQSDVPVGSYLSGGLDSSIIVAAIKQQSPDVGRHSFSIEFTDRELCESRYQRMMADQAGSIHHSILFGRPDIASRLSSAVYHSERPLKESYNTASLALSESARDSGVRVVLNGEGSDELFAGYAGYRFDRYRMSKGDRQPFAPPLEDELRERLWGDASVHYDKDLFAFQQVKALLYSEGLNECLKGLDDLSQQIINKDRVRRRHFIHQRSYLDFKIRLSGHLISDHGDRMAMANSVEARYPFLDINLVEFARTIPPDLKLNGFREKYILKKAAEGLVPRPIIDREKFAFVAPGSPYLLQQNIEWVNDLLSYDSIARQGYFNPDTIEALKSKYSQRGFKLNAPYEDDLLIVVLTFNLLLKLFSLPALI
jgi:asparagine synthase (glutamine-hydrolysing)